MSHRRPSLETRGPGLGRAWGSGLQSVVIGLLCGCVIGVPPAMARTMQQKLDQACAADIAKLCAEAKPDQDRIKACMLTRRAEVSPACMALIDASE